MKILHLEYDQYPKEAIRQLEKVADVEAFSCADQDALNEKLSLSQYDVIFTRLGLMMDEKAILLQPDLKYIVTSTTGLNHIDEKSASALGVSIVSLKGESEFLANVKSTAEHTWGLILSLIRNISGAIDHVRQGGWDRNPFLSDELDGKTLGIIGFGRLGKIVAQYGIAFGMRVLVYDHHPKKVEGHILVEPVELDKLLIEADVVVLLISWSPSNEKFMDLEKLSKMKSSAYFINTARGELVDELALLRILESRKIKGAAVDVLRNDSAWPNRIDESSGLYAYAKSNHNLIITPHMGGYGKDSISKTRNFVTDKFLSLVK